MPLLGYPFPEIDLPVLFIHSKQLETELFNLRTIIEKQKQLIEAYENKHKDNKEVLGLLTESGNLKSQLIKNLEEENKNLEVSNRHNFEAASNLDQSLSWVLFQQNQGGE